MSELEPWSEIESLEDAQRRVLDAVSLLDEHLVRRVLGNKTALEADNPPAVEYPPEDRARLAKRVAIAREEARRQLGEDATSGAKRRADRIAALDVLEDPGLITRTIGGKPSVRAQRRAKASERGSGATDVAAVLVIVPTDSEGRAETSSFPYVSTSIGEPAGPAAAANAVADVVAVETVEIAEATRAESDSSPAYPNPSPLSDGAAIESADESPRPVASRPAGALEGATRGAPNCAPTIADALCVSNALFVESQSAFLRRSLHGASRESPRNVGAALWLLCSTRVKAMRVVLSFSPEERSSPPVILERNTCALHRSPRRGRSSNRRSCARNLGARRDYEEESIHSSL